MCYGPFPAKGKVAAEQLLDDFMSEAAKPLWGTHGRGDLKIIRQLGANTLRTYGNDPEYDHTAFLDESEKVGLGIVPGLSDFPYVQAANRCKLDGFDCYANIKETYLQNLRKGFLKDGNYHPALRHFIVINEPDLKTLDADGIDPKMFSKLIISAVDGLIDAEKEAGVQGTLIKLTATFSFGLCNKCPTDMGGQNHPALSQMLELRNAFLNPHYYGYSPKNDLKAIFETRWINSFNTQNPATQLQGLFFGPYEAEFPTTPVVIEEFHSWQPATNQQLEVATIWSMTQTSPVLHGFNFFEYQVRYDKDGSEMNFGIFGLGDYRITGLPYFGYTYDVWCLTLILNPFDGRPMPEEYALGLGGQSPDFASLCVPDPSKVALNQTGFKSVQGLNSNEKMQIFVTRVAQHMGYNVDTGSRGLSDFSENLASFDALVGMLIAKHYTWAAPDPSAACVANRDSDTVAVSIAVDKACRLTVFNCANIPLECKGDPWDSADYVLSVYYNLQKGEPLSTCYFDGAAKYASKTYYSRYDRGCVVSKDPRTVPLTDEGYQAILNQHDTQKMGVFMQRVIAADFGGAHVGDPKALEDFAANPPGSMYDVKSLLKTALWVCGGYTNRICRVTTATDLWWWKYAFAVVGATLIVGGLITAVWVSMEKKCVRAERDFTAFIKCKSLRKDDPDDDASSEYSS